MIRKSIREHRRRAHLWPPRLIGSRSCWVKRLMNQFWSASRRLFSHRVEGVGKRIQGRLRARAIRGIPRKTGVANWSKKLSVMVSFRQLSWLFRCF